MLLAAAALVAAPPAVRSADEAAYREARQLADRGQWRAVAAKADDALRRFAATDSIWVWSLRGLRADAYLADGDPEQARQLLAAPPPPQYAHSEAAVRRLITLSNAAQRLKDPVTAKRYVDDAAAIVDAHQPRLRGEIIFRRGNLAFNGDKLDDADRLLLASLKLARRQHQTQLELRALAVLARLRGNQQRYDEAVDFYRRALALANAVGDQGIRMNAAGNLGWVFMALGDYDSANDNLLFADAEATRLGIASNRAVWQNLLGNVAVLRHDDDAARQHYQQAIALAQAQQQSIDTYLANLAIAELESGNYEAAARYSRQALELKRKGGKRGAELYSLLTDGRIAAATNRSSDAERLFRQVAGETESTSLRWEAEARLGQLYARLRRDGEADAQFRKALDTADSARDDVKSEDLRLTFQTTVEEIYDAYIDFLVVGGRTDDALRVADDERARTLAEGLKLPKMAADADPRLIARNAGAVILAYRLAPKRSYLWAIDGGAIDFFELPPAAEIKRAIDAYQADLMGGRGTLAGSGARGAELYRMLVAPAAKRIGKSARIAIIPDDRLDAFNMETLVVGAPRPHYWIEDVTLETASSLQLLARSRARRGAGAMLLIGNPPQADPAFPPLPRAGAELARVRSHFSDATTIEGSRATPGAYIGAAPERFAYLHFVAHGVANRRQPLESAVVLAREGESYKLYARDIVKHPLHARLVTISSCHGAGNRTFEGEGLVGLAWAFLRAGAHEVIAALWEVNDSATPELMDAMYARIRAGADPASALREAKLKLVHSAGVYKRPLYWAPFVLYSGS